MTGRAEKAQPPPAEQPTASPATERLNLSELPLTSSHWGTYRVEAHDGVVSRLHAFEHDPDPSPIGHGIVDVLDGPTRIAGPMVRKSWLEGGPGTNNHLRGREPFVAVTWERAEALVAEEIRRVRREFGNRAIFGGSYGWSSAGRFHHAKSQLHRFLNSVGGFVRSKDTYSFAAAEVMVPHVLGTYRPFVYDGPTWTAIEANTELLVAFGGVPLKNGQICQGGVGSHGQRVGVDRAIDAAVQFVNISPLRSDVLDEAGADWLAPRPGTDVAIMLGLAHTLLTNDRHDQAFLDEFTVGFGAFADYLIGRTDGVEKTATWAGAIADIDPVAITDLALRMAGSKTVISTSWSLTRHDHGEQPFWAAVALASMLGGLGKPGEGLAFGLSAVNDIGSDAMQLPIAALSTGFNPVGDFIPVARISDMLLGPGTEFTYDGGVHTYPDIKLMWWCGGNPFHHHQDLGRMVEAWEHPDTIIVNEWSWNANARHADIVLAATTTLERSDLQITPRDSFMSVMEQAMAPVGQARNDYDIFAGIAAKLDALAGEESTIHAALTEGRSAAEWIELIYDETVSRCREIDVDIPTLDELTEKRWHQVDAPSVVDIWAEFRNGRPLATPSGRIEIFSETVAGFGLADCGGHAMWFEPREWLGAIDAADRLHLISNQPKTKLHSQLDHGSVSRAAKIDGREALTMHPSAAAARGLESGDTVRIYNDRGWCLAGLQLDDGCRPDVVQLPTGAWYDPQRDESAEGAVGSPSQCKHGNPNVLTRDQGTSGLAQGPSAHSCIVQVERYSGPPLPVTAFIPPKILS